MTVKQVENSLLEQLRAAGADIDVFKAQVTDYVALYKICTDLKKDIRKRGTIITATGSTGQEITKCNPSIKELRDTNKSMLAILKQLGLSVDSVVTADDDEL